MRTKKQKEKNAISFYTTANESTFGIDRQTDNLKCLQ